MIDVTATATKPPRRYGPQPDQNLRDRILAIATRHPDWSNRRLAREVPCHRRTVDSVITPAARIPKLNKRIRADLLAKAELCGLDVNDVLDKALDHIALPEGWTPAQVAAAGTGVDDDDE